MINIVLVEPEIPQNTGNIARTCAATGAKLHLIKPLGFVLDDKHLKRAGLDYWNLMQYTVYESWQDFLDRNPGANLYYLSTKAPRVLTSMTTLFSERKQRGWMNSSSATITGGVCEYPCVKRPEVSIWLIRWRLCFTRRSGRRDIRAYRAAESCITCPFRLKKNGRITSDGENSNKA